MLIHRHDNNIAINNKPVINSRRSKFSIHTVTVNTKQNSTIISKTHVELVDLVTWSNTH